MKAVNPTYHFPVTRLGDIMRSDPNLPQEAWGVLNPGGVRASDGTMHLFPRMIAEGNYSRIGHARVLFEDDRPVGVERLGIALEPHEPYEVSQGGGGVEDARVVYVPLLKQFVMTYTAFVPNEARIAVAVSEDLETWKRLGVLRYTRSARSWGEELTGNKDGVFFPEPVLDPRGVRSFAIVHRPTTRIHLQFGTRQFIRPARGLLKHESLWISYVPIDAVLADPSELTEFGHHEHLMSAVSPWEAVKIGAGAPPVRLPGGWLLPYHGVSGENEHRRYCMGVAVLDLERPSRVLYQSPEPILEPETEYERGGLVSNVIFPSAADLRADNSLDVYYGAADRVIAVARVGLPSILTSDARANESLAGNPIAG
jgi:predicted GH43/DUF377 family glycosyl hydrolase